MSGTSQETGTPVRYRVVWQLLLTLHMAGAALIFWFMPGGFPLWHPRFWTNRAIPLVAIAVFSMGAISIERRQAKTLQTIALGLTAAGVAACIAALLIFPNSSLNIWPVLAGYSLVMGGLWAMEAGAKPRITSTNGAVVCVAAIVGMFMIWSQQAPAPDTRPINEPLPEFEFSSDVRSVQEIVALNENLALRPREAMISARVGPLTMEIQPLLHFESRSPDRCWTNLARAKDRISPTRQLVGSRLETGLTQWRYRDLAEHCLQVRLPKVADSGIQVFIESHSHLDAPVFSHLNSFAVITIYGHQDLAISFSPCLGDLIAAEPFDYPVGLPIRLAYVDEQQILHVVEASSGEKGPFRELARGAIPPDGSIAVTLHDNGQPVGRIVFDDWAAQAGRVLSPTAGCDLPVNALEFSRTSEAKQSAVVLYLTLAGTSVGRGWDSVGHTAGTYRNRIRFERVNGP